MSRFAVILYPNFSLQEITCLTSALSVWFEEKIDSIASENKEYCSEEGLRVVPTKTMDDTNISDYTTSRLSGTKTKKPYALLTEIGILTLRNGWMEMYRYLNNAGELYFIEVCEKENRPFLH